MQMQMPFNVLSAAVRAWNPRDSRELLNQLNPKRKRKTSYSLSLKMVTRKSMKKGKKANTMKKKNPKRNPSHYLR